jgi:hypothetical protein
MGYYNDILSLLDRYLSLIFLCIFRCGLRRISSFFLYAWGIYFIFRGLTGYCIKSQISANNTRARSFPNLYASLNRSKQSKILRSTFSRFLNVPFQTVHSKKLPDHNQFSLHRFPQVIHYSSLASIPICLPLSSLHFDRSTTPPASTSLLSLLNNPKPPKNRTHLIKTSHRLIRTPNLHLKVRRLHPATLLLRTLRLLLLRIIPGARAAKHILPLLPLELLALVEARDEDVFVGTGVAF